MDTSNPTANAYNKTGTTATGVGNKDNYAIGVGGLCDSVQTFDKLHSGMFIKFDNNIMLDDDASNEPSIKMFRENKPQKTSNY